MSNQHTNTRTNTRTWSHRATWGAVAMLLCGGIAGPVAPVGAQVLASPSFPQTDNRSGPSRTIGGGTRFGAPRSGLRFPQTDDRGGPSRTTGGGTRGGECAAASGPGLTLLLPKNQSGQATSNNPTVFVYVPSTVVRTAEVFVADAEGNLVDRRPVTLPGPAGILKLPLLSSGKTLQRGKTYNWAFSIVCDPSDRASDVAAIGEIQLVSLPETVNQQLTAARDPIRRAQVLAEARLWYDTLSTAVPLQTSQPDQWRSLLESVGLESLATAQFLN